MNDIRTGEHRAGQTARTNELDRVLNTLARHARGESIRIAPQRLLRLGRAILRSRRLRGRDWSSVEQELARVHRQEQAELLRGAAESVLLTQIEGRLQTAPEADEVDLDAWFARCAREIDCAMSSGERVDGELLGCCLLDPREWSLARRLARASLALYDCAEGRLQLARIVFTGGRRAWGETMLAGVLEGDATTSVRARAREALGCACEARADNRRALEHFERAVVLGAGARAEAALYTLALEASDAPRLEVAVERLHQRGEARVARALREVEARRRLMT